MSIASTDWAAAVALNTEVAAFERWQAEAPGRIRELRGERYGELAGDRAARIARFLQYPAELQRPCPRLHGGHVSPACTRAAVAPYYVTGIDHVCGWRA